MKTPTKAESIAKLAQWCVENSSKTFSAFFEWAPHCELVELRVFGCGWRNGSSSPSSEFCMDLEDRDDSFVADWVNETIDELEDLLSQSKQRNSPENAAKLQAELDAKELAAAKAVIARLEGK